MSRLSAQPVDFQSGIIRQHNNFFRRNPAAARNPVFQTPVSDALRLDLSDRIRRIAAQRIGQSRKTGGIFIDLLCK